MPHLRRNENSTLREIGSLTDLLSVYWLVSGNMSNYVVHWFCNSLSSCLAYKQTIVQ